MTKLEQEMFSAINGSDWPPQLGSPLADGLQEMAKVEAKAAAEVAKKYIEKAFIDASYLALAYSATESHDWYTDHMNKWLKENGIISDGPNIETVSPCY